MKLLQHLPQTLYWGKTSISPRVRRITPMVDEPHATDADAEVDNCLHPSDLPREASEGCLGDVVAWSDYDEDTSNVAVEALLSASPLSSSSPVHLSGSSPRTYVDDELPLLDGPPEDPLRPSFLHHHHPRPVATHCGGAASAVNRRGEVIVKVEEDRDGEMLPPSPVAAERPLGPATPLWRHQEKKVSITFSAQEIDEKMYTIFDYEVGSDSQGHEGNISKLSITNSFPFEGVTNLTLSFKCPGPRSEDDDKCQERRRDAISETLCRLGAILGGSLRGLEVTAPWPELSFPYIPDILEVILDSFPALGNLRFGDLQCECCDCESVYTDPAKFRRLQVASLKGQVSGPITAAMLQTVVIEKKSLHALGKDFTKYVGDAERLLDEALFGTCTVTKGEGPTAATARSQQEAQFFAKLLKRGLPSTLHFLVINPELQVLYEAPSSSVESLSADSVRSSKSPSANPGRDTPDTATQASFGPETPSYREGSIASSCTYSTSGYTPPPNAAVAPSVDDPSFDLSGDISLEDEVSDELAHGMDHVDEAPQDYAFARGYGGRPADIQPRGLGDADPVQGAIFASERDWWAEFMSMAEEDGLGVGADIDIGVVPPLASESFRASSSPRVDGLFGGGEGYTCASESYSVGILDDVRQHRTGDVDCDQQVRVPPDSHDIGTADVGFPELFPPGWLRHDDSTVRVPEEFRMDAGGGQMCTCFDNVDLTAFMPPDEVDDAGVGVGYPPTPPTCAYPDSEELFSYGSSHDYGVDRGPSPVTLREGADGEPGGPVSAGDGRPWGDMNVS